MNRVPNVTETTLRTESLEVDGLDISLSEER
jgi:hypothetical protein